MLVTVTIYWLHLHDGVMAAACFWSDAEDFGVLGKAIRGLNHQFVGRVDDFISF